MPAPDLVTSRASTPETVPNTDEMMDVPETAKRFGVHHQTVYRWLRTGTFPCHAVRIENTWRISRASVDGYLHGRALELAEVES
jgi:excisionase family DNA binding protein